LKRWGIGSFPRRSVARRGLPVPGKLHAFFAVQSRFREASLFVVHRLKVSVRFRGQVGYFGSQDSGLRFIQCDKGYRAKEAIRACAIGIPNVGIFHSRFHVSGLATNAKETESLRFGSNHNRELGDRRLAVRHAQVGTRVKVVVILRTFKANTKKV
jgi:hypothetical protein